MRQGRMQIKPEIERDDSGHRAAERSRTACLHEHACEEHGEERGIGEKRPCGERTCSYKTCTSGAVDCREGTQPVAPPPGAGKKTHAHPRHKQKTGERRR